MGNILNKVIEKNQNMYFMFNTFFSDNPDSLGNSGKFVEKSTKLTFLGITGYRIKYSTVLWLLELHMGLVRRV
jgi:hypothetical protein